MRISRKRKPSIVNSADGENHKNGNQKAMLESLRGFMGRDVPEKGHENGPSNGARMHEESEISDLSLFQRNSISSVIDKNKIENKDLNEQYEDDDDDIMVKPFY